MKEAIEVLTFQMQEAQRTLDWCISQRAELAIKMQRANRDMYHAKDQINRLKAQQDAAH